MALQKQKRLPNRREAHYDALSHAARARNGFRSAYESAVGRANASTTARHSTRVYTQQSGTQPTTGRFV
jgi:hypothetical protein